MDCIYTALFQSMGWWCTEESVIIFLKDTLRCRFKGPGIVPLTVWLVGDPLCLLSHIVAVFMIRRLYPCQVSEFACSWLHKSFSPDSASLQILLNECHKHFQHVAAGESLEHREELPEEVKTQIHYNRLERYVWQNKRWSQNAFIHS